MCVDVGDRGFAPQRDRNERMHGSLRPGNTAATCAVGEDYASGRVDVDGLAAQIHVARSNTPVREAKNFEYKITFTRSGRTIDPNMRCI